MQWRERAIVMAAALAARNYENDDRDEIEMWRLSTPERFCSGWPE
jgi:hypothetical protein